ncbi:MAG TPA: hypothetical protein VIC84_03650 [Blastocatellia bacterium]|jgi:hypothetical protein
MTVRCAQATIRPYALQSIRANRSRTRTRISAQPVSGFLFLILFALPSEDHVFDFEQRDLLFLQLSDYVEESSQQGRNQSSLSFIKFVLLDFLDQDFYFGWIDLWNLI